MTTATLIVWAIAGLLISGLAATSNKVLQEFSRRDLELYCSRRKRLKLFGEILDHYEEVLLGTENLQMLGTLALLGAFWAAGPEMLVGRQFAVGLVGVTLLLLAAHVWIPRAVVHLWASPFLFHMWRVLWFISLVVWPLTAQMKLVNALMRRLADHPVTEEDEEEAFEDEIRSIVTEGLHDGVLEEDAREMIEGVIELGDADVSDIMTPRSNIDAVDVQLSWPELLDFVVDAGRTRIPVYEGNLDSIVGVLYVKDLLHQLSGNGQDVQKPLREVLREPWFVPDTKPLDEMLQEFQQTRSHLAIVVDEYLSVAGVVTIEDVLEEIVGEIVDESDKDVEQEITPLGESGAEVLGIAHVDSVNERLGLELPEPDEVDTIAGLVISRLGHIPKTGESLVADGARITVLDASRRHVDRLLIELIGEG